MKRIQMIGGMLAVAALLAGPATFADESPWSSLQQGYERVDLRGSAFVVGHGATKEVEIPHGPRDLDRVFVQANTKNCAESNITVTAVSEDRRADSKLVRVNGEPNWYILRFGAQNVRTIAVTHTCGFDVQVHLIKAELGQHAIDCVFNCKDKDCEQASKDLTQEIIRRMPKSGKYFYLLETLDRLSWKTADFLALGDDKVKIYIAPLVRGLNFAKATTLVQGDGTYDTIQALIKVRGMMKVAEEFFIDVASTKASKQIGEAWITVGALIDSEAHLPASAVEEACLLHQAKLDQRAEEEAARRPRIQRVQPKNLKGVPVLPAPQDDEESKTEEIPN